MQLNRKCQCEKRYWGGLKLSGNEWIAFVEARACRTGDLISLSYTLLLSSYASAFSLTRCGHQHRRWKVSHSMIISEEYSSGRYDSASFGVGYTTF